MEKYSGKLKSLILKRKIRDLLLLVLIYFGVSPAASAQQLDSLNFKTGADQPELYLPSLKNKQIAVVTNQTGLLKDGTFLVDFLVKNEVKIKTIFAPEHGFRGEADAGETVKNETDGKTGIPIVSLYGKNKKPTSQQLSGVDIIVFDIQDVGVRFYTYISTLTYVMEAAAENGVEVLVLDRPNPHDGYIDGPVLKEAWKSFVGMHPVPVVYGLTIGEYGAMVNGEKWLSNGMRAKYTVVPLQNYHKNQRYKISAAPSPNLPNEQAIALYPSLCFFEGTQVSVGRGTSLPFQIYGSPWLKDMPYEFTPRPSVGAKDPFLNSKICFGENLALQKADFQQLELRWLLKAYRQYTNPAEDFFLANLFFDKLAGTDELRKQIIAGKSEATIRKTWQNDLQRFEKIRAKYIIYPN